MPPRPPRTDHTHVLLLRGINLGARNRVPKQDLVRWAEQAGAQDVTTHLASGNILFRLAGVPDVGPASADAVAAGVRAAARAERELDVSVLWAPVAELRAALSEHDALPWAGGDPKHTALTLLSTAPDADALERLAALPHRRDHTAVRGRHLWLRYHDGVADSPLTLARIERALGVTGTARNLSTVRALAGVTEPGAPARIEISSGQDGRAEVHLSVSAQHARESTATATAPTDAAGVANASAFPVAAEALAVPEALEAILTRVGDRLRPPSGRTPSP